MTTTKNVNIKMPYKNKFHLWLKVRILTAVVYLLGVTIEAESIENK